jgi:hypothetical protein
VSANEAIYQAPPSRLRELEAEMGDLTEPAERGDWLPVESPRRRSAGAEGTVPGMRRTMPQEAPGAKRSAEPTIRVTIGRIEVRPLDEKAKPVPGQKTVFSLEGYLRGRRRQGW